MKKTGGSFPFGVLPPFSFEVLLRFLPEMQFFL
jgi:hypothetical protein